MFQFVVLIVQNAIVLNKKYAMAVMNTKVLFFTAMEKNVPFIIVVLQKMVLKIVQNAAKFPVKFGKKLGIPNFLMKNLLKILKKELRC